MCSKFLNNFDSLIYYCLSSYYFAWIIGLFPHQCKCRRNYQRTFRHSKAAYGWCSTKLAVMFFMTRLQNMEHQGIFHITCIWLNVRLEPTHNFNIGMWIISCSGCIEKSIMFLNAVRLHNLLFIFQNWVYFGQKFISVTFLILIAFVYLIVNCCWVRIVRRKPNSRVWPNDNDKQVVRVIPLIWKIVLETNFFCMDVTI